MQISVMELRLFAPWVHSLKEKRMIVKSLIARIRNKFNVSIAETEHQDTHQIIGITMCCVFSNQADSHSVWNNILRFIEDNTEAEIIHINSEFR